MPFDTLTIDLCKKAEEHYTNGVNLMHKKDYESVKPILDDCIDKYLGKTK